MALALDSARGDVDGSIEAKSGFIMSEQDDHGKVSAYLRDAERGDAFAQVNLGIFYQSGRGGLPKDDREAARHYKLAADQGNAWGQLNLGNCYEYGRGGLPKDDREAARLYKLAADQGNATARVDLGAFCETGRGGLPNDDREAARLYKLAADQGNAFAQVNLGTFYRTGRGSLPKDDREAAQLYKLAADQGNASGQLYLGNCYEHGRGLPKDDHEAARLYKLAADQGDATAQSYLGSFYRDGLGGLPRNDQEAARLFKLAAEQADTSGQANLGFFYENGRGGLPKDDREAARLYKLAAAKNSAYARDALARLRASSDNSKPEVRARDIARFSPGRVFRSGLAITISYLIMATIVGVLIHFLAYGNLPGGKIPAGTFIFLGVLLLGFMWMVLDGIGRMRAAFSKNIYFRAGSDGIFIRFPVGGWVSYPVYAYHLRWEEVAQIQWFIHRYWSHELRIFLKSGGRLTVPGYIFDKSASTLRNDLWESRHSQ